VFIIFKKLTFPEEFILLSIASRSPSDALKLSLLNIQSNDDIGISFFNAAMTSSAVFPPGKYSFNSVIMMEFKIKIRSIWARV
jgi:hypothetical protein